MFNILKQANVFDKWLTIRIFLVAEPLKSDSETLEAEGKVWRPLNQPRSHPACMRYEITKYERYENH